MCDLNMEYNLTDIASKKNFIGAKSHDGKILHTMLISLKYKIISRFPFGVKTTW